MCIRDSLQSIQAHALNGDDAAVGDGADGDAHRPQAGGCTQGVFCWEQAIDCCGALGDGAKQQGSVRDRFIAWNLHPSLEASSGLELTGVIGLACAAQGCFVVGLILLAGLQALNEAVEGIAEQAGGGGVVANAPRM